MNVWQHIDNCQIRWSRNGVRFLQKKKTYFQLVKYPVQAAAQMNNKLLTAQLARRGKADWADSDRAYDSIVSLTKSYNTTKWNRMMDFQPRRLPVFNRVERKALSSGLPEKRQAVYTWNGADCAEGVSAICEGLGYVREGGSRVKE